jgi:hypothetical protein
MKNYVLAKTKFKKNRVARTRKQAPRILVRACSFLSPVASDSAPPPHPSLSLSVLPSLSSYKAPRPATATPPMRRAPPPLRLAAAAAARREL